MIEFKNISKSFGSLTVLDNISGEFPENKITAIVGHNGSGKTTLIKCILGLDQLDNGSIKINGTEINGNPEFRKMIGYMPQIARFPENLNARELIAMVADLRDNISNESDSLIDYFQLYDSLDKPLGQLSGGTKQKVNAVIAMMFDPKVLILDEPSAGLDPVSSQQLKKSVLEKKKQGKSVLITSHILSELQELADYLIYLLDGKIFFKGTVETLIEQSGQPTLESAIAKMMGAQK